MSQVHVIRVGEGSYEIIGIGIQCGQDASLTFMGGTKNHVGAVSLGIYEPERNSASVSTMTVISHRDDLLSMECAKKAAIAFKGCVSVSVGVHIDHANDTDIHILCQNFKTCSIQLIEELQHQKKGVSCNE